MTTCGKRMKCPTTGKSTRASSSTTCSGRSISQIRTGTSTSIWASSRLLMASWSRFSSPSHPSSQKPKRRAPAVGKTNQRRHRANFSYRQWFLLKATLSTFKIPTSRKKYARMSTICCLSSLCSKLVENWLTILLMRAYSLKSSYPSTKNWWRRFSPMTKLVTATSGKLKTSMSMHNLYSSFTKSCRAYNHATLKTTAPRRSIREAKDSTVWVITLEDSCCQWAKTWWAWTVGPQALSI